MSYLDGLTTEQLRHRLFELLREFKKDDDEIIRVIGEIERRGLSESGGDCPMCAKGYC